MMATKKKVTLDPKLQTFIKDFFEKDNRFYKNRGEQLISFSMQVCIKINKSELLLTTEKIDFIFSNTKKRKNVITPINKKGVVMKRG